MRIIPLLLFLSAAFPAWSQQKDAFYFLDDNWKPTPKQESAKYFIRLKEISDTCWQWDYYNIMGPLMRTAQYRDKSGSELNGRVYYYDHTGRLDSLTTWRHGKRNGDSYKYRVSDSLVTQFKYVYKDDSLIEFVDVTHEKKGSLDTVEVESEYPGGTQRWLRYLNKNLRYPDRAFNASIEGGVFVGFIVDMDGTVIQPFITKSVEYSLDDESIRIISQSGKWTPAVQHGRPVRSYKLQPIVFRLR